MPLELCHWAPGAPILDHQGFPHSPSFEEVHMIDLGFLPPPLIVYGPYLSDQGVPWGSLCCWLAETLGRRNSILSHLGVRRASRIRLISKPISSLSPDVLNRGYHAPAATRPITTGVVSATGPSPLKFADTSRFGTSAPSSVQSAGTVHLPDALLFLPPWWPVAHMPSSI